MKATCGRRVVTILSVLLPLFVRSIEAIGQGPSTIPAAQSSGTVIPGGASAAVTCPEPGQFVHSYKDQTAPTLASNPVRVNHATDYLLGSIVTKGDQIEGPRRVVLLYLNRLRYSFGASVDVTFVQNPSLPQALVASSLVPVASAGTKTTVVAAAPPTEGQTGFEAKLASITACIDNYKKEQDEVNTDAVTVTTAISNAKTAYEELLNFYPAILSLPQAVELRSRAAGLSAENSVLSLALSQPFPADHARAVITGVDNFLATLALLEKTDEFAKWSAAADNMKRYTDQRSGLMDVKSGLAAKAPGSAPDTEAKAAQDKIAYWRARFAGFGRLKINEPVPDGRSSPGREVTMEDLALIVDTNCSTAFGRGKESKVNFTVTDLFGTASETSVGTVTVACAPVLSISVGVGFSTLPQRTAGFIYSAGPNGITVQKIGFTDDNSLRPIYVGLVNASLASVSANWTVHATVGAAVTSRSDGTAVEYLFGPTLAFKRVVFLTPALHVGKRTDIIGGFNENDTKPADLQAVPTRSTLASGLRGGRDVCLEPMTPKMVGADRLLSEGKLQRRDVWGRF